MLLSASTRTLSASCPTRRCSIPPATDPRTQCAPSGVCGVHVVVTPEVDPEASTDMDGEKVASSEGESEERPRKVTVVSRWVQFTPGTVKAAGE